MNNSGKEFCYEEIEIKLSLSNNEETTADIELVKLHLKQTMFAIMLVPGPNNLNSLTFFHTSVRKAIVGSQLLLKN